MSEDRPTQADDAGEPDLGDTETRYGALDLVSRVPFGMQVALLAGVVVAGAGVAGGIAAFGPFGSTCCPPVIG